MFILNYFSLTFSLGVAISLAFFSSLKFPFLPISYKLSHLKVLHLNKVKEDVSPYSWNFCLHLCLYLCFFFFFNPRRWMQIWQLSFDTAGSYCSENDPVWVVSTVSLSVQMNSSVLTSRIAATSNFITSSGSTNVQSIVNVKR